jgi:cephalosporin-C deacetylase-like acetyl esterase
MTRYFAAVAALMFLLPLATAHGAENFPDVSALPAQAELPDPLKMLDGRKVTTKEQWFNERRPELKALFQHYMYGSPPPAPKEIHASVERVDANYFGGKATKKEVTIEFGPAGTPTISLLMVVPNKRTKPAPVFVGMNFCGNHTLLADTSIVLPKSWMPARCPGVVDNHATESGRGTQVDVWNLENSIDRGYAVATFYSGDIDPDLPDFTDGVHPHYLKPGQSTLGPHDWGTIAAWAWGISRAVDYLVTDKDLDAAKIIVVGHSRLGKTALLAAAMDDRIAMAIPLQAGCGGTSPSRGKVGESVERINTSFPHWFNDTFPKFNQQVERLPFDQHCLVALVAPRPVLFANAVEDTWANPDGQFEVLQAADPVYRLLGAGGLDAKQMPPMNQLVPSTLGYFIRPGKHSMSRIDWDAFLDFADKQFGKP